MTFTRARSPLALTLAFVVACSLSPASLIASTGAASFSGQVLQSDGRTPQAAVTVILVDGQRQSRVQATTGEDGTFRIEGAPTGSYSLIVDTADGAFIAVESLTLAAGVNPRQTLTLRRGPQAAGGAGQSLAGVTWGQWLIAGAVVIAAVVIANEVTDDSEEPASPF